ncbi:sensor domain-containing protein [Mycobacterium hubeiense]|uniref:sensor domain-containing protein n=1 Tax=Mycobacterium hubeiense TaxID=1867256 RepID=UPI00115705ED|nr:sensor domain-containing protein [Mycobacterium sp. QGD 101]
MTSHEPHDGDAAPNPPPQSGGPGPDDPRTAKIHYTPPPPPRPHTPPPAAHYSPPPPAGPPAPPPPQQPFGPAPGWTPPPPGWAPPQQRRDLRWWLLGGMALLAVVAIVVVLATSGSDAPPTATPPSGPAPQPTAADSPQPPTQAAPPTAVADSAGIVDPAALPKLLLPADKIRQGMKSPGMVAGEIFTAPSTDAVIAPPNCAGAWAPADNATYAGAGFTGMAAQVVKEEPRPLHQVIQAVVSFPDAASAKNFYDKQPAEWSECRFTAVTAQSPDKTETATIGATATGDEVLIAHISVKGVPDAPYMACQRGLAARANVIIDVRGCSPQLGSPGYTFARDISQLITGKR